MTILTIDAEPPGHELTLIDPSHKLQDSDELDVDPIGLDLPVGGLLWRGIQACGAIWGEQPNNQ